MIINSKQPVRRFAPESKLELFETLVYLSFLVKTREGAHGGIQTVFVGLQEPDTFIHRNTGKTQLEKAGITCIHVTGLEEDILRIATAGHQPNQA